MPNCSGGARRESRTQPRLPSNAAKGEGSGCPTEQGRPAQHACHCGFHQCLTRRPIHQCRMVGSRSLRGGLAGRPPVCVALVRSLSVVAFCSRSDGRGSMSGLIASRSYANVVLHSMPAVSPACGKRGPWRSVGRSGCEKAAAARRRACFVAAAERTVGVGPHG